MKLKVVCIACMLFGASCVFAQEQLSLHQCVNHAVESNAKVNQADFERIKSTHKTAEVRSNYLPKVDVNGMFQNNMELPYTVIPGAFLGQPGTFVTMQMGAQYNTSASLAVSQVLYNQTLITSLKLSKKAEYATALGVEKAKEEIAKEVAKLYFLSQTTAEQEKLLEGNIERIKRMSSIVKMQVANGVAKNIDYERIAVNLQNAQTQLSNTLSMHEQQLTMLKYMMGMPLTNEVVLTDSVGLQLVKGYLDSNVDLSDHIDIQLLEAKQEIASLNQKAVNHGYVPSLVFFGQYGYNGMRDRMRDYFNDSPLNKWFSSSYIGFKLSVPIFDGFQKRSQSRVARVEYRQASLSLSDTKESFTAKYNNTLNAYRNSKQAVHDQLDNIKLAQKVYEETSLKYKEGVASLSTLLQDEMSLNSAQAGYLSALYSFKEAELEIMSLTGEIKTLISK